MWAVPVTEGRESLPLSVEIYDEPGVPQVSGVLQVLHPPGESDSAIHIPARSDGGEEGEDDTGGHSEPEEGEVVGSLTIRGRVDVARARLFQTPSSGAGGVFASGLKIVRGVLRTALRLSFHEAAEAHASGNVEQETRAWNHLRLCHECC